MALKDQYLTVSQAVQEYGVTRQTIHRWIRDGVLEAEKVGREVLINRQSMTEHRMSKVGEMMSKMVSWWLASDNFQPIRDKLNLGQKDIIRTCGKIEDLTFIVTHEDGLKEKIGIKQYGMTTDDKNRSFRYCIDEIGRSEYKLNTKLKHNKINDKKIGSAGTDNPRL